MLSDAAAFGEALEVSVVHTSQTDGQALWGWGPNVRRKKGPGQL